MTRAEAAEPAARYARGVTLLVVCLSVTAVVCFLVLLAALRMGSSDHGFRAGRTGSGPSETVPQSPPDRPSELPPSK